MLNLTPDPIVIIAESGETTTIAPSGYIARVETTRRVADHFYFGANGLKHRIPYIEETPTEIVVDYTAFGVAESHPLSDELPTTAGALLLVAREVAEAAATLKHPLAARMVWAHNDEPHSINGVEHYRSLRRVPGGAK